MDCNRRSYSYNTWIFFWEDFNHFITKDFDRLGQYYLKELRSQLKETYRPLTDAEFEHLLAIFEGLPIKALPIEALPVDTGTNEPPKTDSFTFEALPLETNEPVDTDNPLETNEPVDTDNPLETDERNEPAILFATVIEPLMGTSISSIPKSQSTTTLVLPQSIPFTSGCLAYTLSLPSSIPATGFG